MSQVEVFAPGKPSGLSTDRELKLLNEAWPELTRGQVITHEEVLAVLKMSSRNSPRYRTVTERWRRSIFQTMNLVIAAVPNVGFRVLEEGERLDHSERLGSKGKRAIRRGHRVLITTDEKLLTHEERAKLELRCGQLERIAALIHQQAKEKPSLPSATV